MQNIKIDPIVFRVEGTGGAGGSSIGEILTRSAARCGYYIQCSRAFPAEIKGGRAWLQLKASSKPLNWWGGIPNLEMNDTKSGDWTFTFKRYPVDEPLIADFSPQKTAKKLGESRSSNVVALGFLSATLGFDFNIVLEIATQRYGRRGTAPEGLETMIRAGYDAALTIDNWIVWETEPPEIKSKRIVLNGNEAIAIGAMAAGIKFFAGYPITPASSILEMMLNDLPSLGGNAVQFEDEIAAIGACLGASYAGKKAMCATSGPGFALMSEMLNLAVMAELPITIIDVQRSGPATGQPSRSEQADLLYAIYGSPGDVQRIVLAPSTVEEALYMTIEAVNLSEKYQMPVIVLSDAALSNRIEAVNIPDWENLQLIGRTKPASDVVYTDFKRYEFSEDGVSAIPVPGLNELPYIASGMEHDEIGKPSGDMSMHYSMSDKRITKLASAAKFLANEPYYNGVTPQTKIGIIGWGSTKGAISDAALRLQKIGIAVATAHVKYLNPINEEKLGEWMNMLEVVIVAEENRTGQLATLIRHLAPNKIKSLFPKSEAELTPEYITENIKTELESLMLMNSVLLV